MNPKDKSRAVMWPSFRLHRKEALETLKWRQQENMHFSAKLEGVWEQGACRERTSRPSGLLPGNSKGGGKGAGPPGEILMTTAFAQSTTETSFVNFVQQLKGGQAKEKRRHRNLGDLHLVCVYSEVSLTRVQWELVPGEAGIGFQPIKIFRRSIMWRTKC